MYMFSYSLNMIILMCAKKGLFEWEGPICHIPSGFIEEQKWTFIIQDLTYNPVLWPSTHRSYITQVPGGNFSTFVTPYHQNERQFCPNILEVLGVLLEVRNDPCFKECARWGLWSAHLRAKTINSLTEGSIDRYLSSHFTIKLFIHFLGFGENFSVQIMMVIYSTCWVTV